MKTIEAMKKAADLAAEEVVKLEDQLNQMAHEYADMRQQWLGYSSGNAESRKEAATIAARMAELKKTHKALKEKAFFADIQARELMREYFKNS